MVIELPIDNSVRNSNLAELSTTTTTTVSLPLLPLPWSEAGAAGACLEIRWRAWQLPPVATAGQASSHEGQGKPKERNNQKRQWERLRDKGEVEAIKLTRICKLWKTFSWNTLTWGSIVQLLDMKLNLGKYKYSNGSPTKVRNNNWVLNL